MHVQNDDDEKRQVKNSELLAGLNDFNDELNISMETRGFWGSLGRICAIVGADAIGAVEGGKVGGTIGSFVGPQGMVVGAAVGGVICGAGASYGAYKGTTRALALNSSMLYRGVQTISKNDLFVAKTEAAVNVGLISKYQNVEKVALEHNVLLDRVMKGETFENVDVSKDPYAAAFNSQEFNNSYQKAVDEAVLFTQVLQNSTSKPIVAVEGLSLVGNKVLSLFFEVYTRYPDKLEDIDFVVDYYMDAIEASSELTTEEKESIFTGLAVAAYSPRLWMNEIE